MQSLEVYFDALQRAGCRPARTGSGSIQSLCPIHEADGKPHKPSLSVAHGDKVDVVMTCHAGCSHSDILKALGIQSTSKADKRHEVATYPYHDASGRVVFEKVRYEPKDFRIRHHDDSGDYVYKLPRGIEPPLYRLPAVKAAMASGEPIYFVEGCKDADRLVAAGLCATTNFEGATGKKWRDSYTVALTGADLVLLPDNDEPGRAHTRNIAMALSGKARRIRTLELSGLPVKGDVSDWLNLGHSIDELKALVEGLDSPMVESAKSNLIVPLSEFIGTPKPTTWRVRRLLPAASIVQFFGDPSAGKSFLTVDLSCHIATGKPWFGRPVKQCVVLYMIGEGLEGLKRRFEAWKTYRGDVSDEFLKVTQRPFRLDPEGAQTILNEVAAMPVKPEFVVIDTLNTMLDGNENDARDIGRFFDVLKQFTTQYGATVVYNHHPGHNNKERSRGHSGIGGSLDCDYRLEKQGTHDGILTVTKPPKDSAIPDPIAYRLDIVELPEAWQDQDYPDEPETTCLFTVTGVAQPSAKPLPEQQRKALKLLDELYQQQRSNLESAGHDPNQARVTAADWYEAMRGICEDSGNRSRLRSALKDCGHVRIENGFVYQAVRL